MKIYSKSDVGLVRESNQDAYNSQILSESSAWAVVCDGMGGANGGNIASQIAVECITKHIESLYCDEIEDKKIESFLVDAVRIANQSIYEESLSRPKLFGMGTTAILALLKDYVLHIAHVGDSRAYLINKDNINQVTTDHSIVQEMLKTGEITKEQALNHPRKNIITRALGVENEVKIDYICKNVQKDDTILICTDGLTNYVEPQEIKDLLETTNKDILTDLLISKAKKLGGKDNITVVIISQ